jgi:hypothetical protein
LGDENQAVLSASNLSTSKLSPKSARALPKNHVDAGTAHFLDERHLSSCAAAVIHAHHIGFADFTEELNREKAPFRDAGLMDETDRDLSEFEERHRSLIGGEPPFSDAPPCGDTPVFLRMALSCLADADHTDTAINYGNYPQTENWIPLRPRERLERLDQYVAGLCAEGGGERADLRREMYLECRNAMVTSNICSCDSPVGSGKTTAVMAYMLANADRRKLRRIFVVLPFVNIIAQSVEIYRKALVLPGENPAEVVAELHHRADFESEEARYLTALWRAPIIVTTAVTFFETLASNSTATLRRLHELPGSAVFVDESHAALPATLLPIAWRWIKILAYEWNCHWVLASGSLCRFLEIEEIAGEETTKDDVPEIVNDSLRGRLSRYENRHVAFHCDSTPKNAEELVDWIVQFKGPRLAILNTVQNAAVLADYFRERFGRERVEHLSTALTPADREKTLERVRQRLKSPEDVDWTFVATSCVEAGVDLSFRTGFREFGSLVSLLQTAGRIDREGKYDDSEIWAFCVAEGGMFNTNPGLENAAELLRGYFKSGRKICPERSTKSIEDEIKRYGLSSKHKALIRDEQSRRFPCVESAFKVIETDTRIALVDQDLADSIRSGNIDWRVLQKNSIQIARYKLEEVRAPVVLDGIYRWNLGYDAFLGYMKGLVELKKFEKTGMIV